MTTRRTFQANPKQPAEISALPIDFTPNMILAGEVVSSATVTVAIRTGASGGLTGDVTPWMLVNNSVTISGNVVTFQVQNGSDGADYTVDVRATTNQGRIEEGRVILPVRVRGKGPSAPLIVPS